VLPGDLRGREKWQSKVYISWLCLNKQRYTGHAYKIRQNFKIQKDFKGILRSDTKYIQLSKKNTNMMDDRKLTEIYTAKIAGNETIDGRGAYVLELTAKVNDAAYYSQRIWVDAERFVPLKQEMFAKSGQLLKRTILSDVKQVQGRWFPMTVNYKDVLKEGEGTEFRITNAKFDQEIPEYIFTKAALKK
jgi:outer membrane lipoprotein-sorting protein